MTELQVPYSMQHIESEEQPKWGDYKKTLPRMEVPLQPGEMLLPSVEHYVNQTDPNGFSNFEKASVILKTGYHAEFMRAHACGISCTWMVCSAIADPKFLAQYQNVGTFTESALKYHTNDLLDSNGQILKKGTPVFSPRNGWYHNALIGVSHHLAAVEGFRMEDLTLEQLAQVLTVEDRKKTSMAIISVKNEHWRKEDESLSKQTHLVVVNGFKINENSAISEIRVSDPYAPSSPKNNIWLAVNAQTRKAFTGRAIVLHK